MYIPKHHEETDLETIHALIRAHPLGALITQDDGRLNANHVVFLIDDARGECGTLVGHVARANPVWKALATDALVIFQGPEGYISPSWYPSKQAHGRAVPTWNYAVVHAHGRPRAIEDKDWLRAHLNDLVTRNESGFAVPWRISDAPEDFVQAMLNAIVGIEIPIARLEAKWKVSQNRDDADKLGVIAGLTARGAPGDAEMAEMVRGAIGKGVKTV